MFCRFVLLLSVVALQSLLLDAVAVTPGVEITDPEHIPAAKQQVSSLPDDQLVSAPTTPSNLENAGSDDSEGIMRRWGRRGGGGKRGGSGGGRRGGSGSGNTGGSGSGHGRGWGSGGSGGSGGYDFGGAIIVSPY